MKILATLLALFMLCSCGVIVPIEEEGEKNPKEEVFEQQTPEPAVTPTASPTPTAKPTVSPAKAPSGEISGLNNEGSGWGFKKNKNAPPEIYAKTQQLLRQYDAFYMDRSGRKVLFLTFDEGYENGYSAQILDTLKEYNVPAAFFVTGSYFDRETELVDRMVAEGHIVGNHTENHPNLHKLADPEKMKSEFKELDDKFFQRYGFHMTYMRPPEGEYSERVLATAQDAGYKTAFWSFAYRDWERDKIMGADYAFEQVTPYLHSGAVILLHAVSPDNAGALARIITHAREAGYEFASLDELVL